MKLPKFKVKMAFDSIKAKVKNESSNDEPYIITFFFKVDGETYQLPMEPQHVGAEFRVHHDAHENLGQEFTHVDQVIPIPPHLGIFEATLSPIRISILGSESFVGGIIGVLVIALEEDATLDRTADAIHEDLNYMIPFEINAILRQLTPEIVWEKITEIMDRGNATLSNLFTLTIQELLTERLIPAVSRIQSQLITTFANSETTNFNFFGLLDTDDVLGARYPYYSQESIAANQMSIPLKLTFSANGTYEMTGQLTAESVYTLIKINDLPPGNEIQVMHVSPDYLDPQGGGAIGFVGGTTSRGNWKATTRFVAAVILSGQVKFYTKAADGTKSYLYARKVNTAIATAAPRYIYYLSSSPNDTEDDNLSNLPPCKKFVEEN